MRFTVMTDMTDIALFRLPDGRAWIGHGPFESMPQMPAEGGAFYVNDFDLADPAPWKRPARLSEVAAETLAGSVGWNGAVMPRVQWAKPPHPP
jgi:menaquinone-specific isochorismate synthase